MMEISSHSSVPFCFLVSLLFFCLCSSAAAANVTYDGRAIIIDGQRKLLVSGSIHYPRSTAQMWPDLVKKAKEGGLDAIDTYIFWDVHEPRKGQYNFDGDLDFIKFIKIVQAAGLYVVLRIGPYVCAEWNYGAFPVWLHQIPGIELRTNNDIYKAEMQKFTTLIVDMVKKENLLASQGGPIILTQIENEYGNFIDKYGDAGKQYLQWCVNMAVSLNVGVPWIMCQQADAPPPTINTCNGFYCHKFVPNREGSPKMWTENWTGWFQAWGDAQPHRPAEDVAYAVAYFFASGGTYQNYYMYHGGTNFGRTSGGPFLVTSYDYDAPLDEYGNIKQPKWGHLKKLHSAIRLMEKALTYGDLNTTNIGNGVAVMKYSAEDTSGCFLVNVNGTNDVNVTYNGNEYFVPGRSISVLPDCVQEAYNTAKVTTQTTLMINKPASSNFSWQWHPEKIKDTLKGKGSFSNNSLLEQIMTTGDTSDYLWYMTSVTLNQSDPLWNDTMNLRVQTKGHILHAYVNKHLIGSQFATKGNYKFVFEQAAKFQVGVNFITLLSATDGLANYGAFYDMQRAGIDGGPVKIIGNGNNSLDLSNNTWSYKVGLNGERSQIYSPSSHHSAKWKSDTLPTNQPMTWYKTTFEVPTGDGGLVLDLEGMSKGEAWVNGKSIGRYWLSFIAGNNGCGPCDHRQQYNSDNCRTGCGKPSQRWYHVPRSYTTQGPNTLVLFEEVGGDVSQVNLQTVAVGTVCANVLEGSTLELSCQGEGSFSEIQFASFGNPQGSCGSFTKGSCDAPGALDVVKKACIGQSQCSINVAESVFSSSGCSEPRKSLAVQAVC
ncbi:beta-galactosidase 15-like [Curcuma longa]|uniref:beta-galactosidase 15-like n=1 Tax=Curcuma longa TaxID=136217 RepID=UPI003D9F5C3D